MPEYILANHIRLTHQYLLWNFKYNYMQLLQFPYPNYTLLHHLKYPRIFATKDKLSHTDHAYNPRIII